MYTYHNNVTINILEGTIGYTVASALLDVVFRCGGQTYFIIFQGIESGSCFYAHLTLPLNLLHIDNTTRPIGNLINSK